MIAALNTPSLAAATVSPWVALPIAAIALVVIAWHSTGLDRRAMPRSRRRIRQANSWVMMLCAPLFAAGASVIDAERSPRAFVLVWTVVGMLVVLSVALAIADALNTWRLLSRRRRAGRVGRPPRGATPSTTPQSPHDE